MKSKNTDAKGRHTGTTAMGKSILSALHDLADTLEAGTPLEEKYVVHKYQIQEPGTYGPKEIKALRGRLGVSQAFFAAMVGASIVLVSKWEQGRRNPDGMARRLMDLMSADPDAFLKLVATSPRKKAS